MSQKAGKEGKTTEIRIASVVEDPLVVVGTFFNGVSFPETTTMDIYKHKKKNQNYLLHGENDTLVYDGQSLEKDSNDYYVAVYNPVSKSVDLFKSPFVSGNVSAKSKKRFRGPAIKQVGVRNMDQRNKLGVTFGTKKAKQAIDNIDRNRIDADKLSDVQHDIVENLQESTQQLPTKQDLDKSAETDRPTPVANVSATNVEDVYPIHNIIPKREWSLLRVAPLLETSGDLAQKLEILPYSKSPYVQLRLPKLISIGSTEKLQLLYYASLLFGVYDNRRLKDKATLLEKLGNKPLELLIDGILERFTVARTSQYGKLKDRSFIIDPHHEDKLLCYLLAIILHIDNYLVEMSPLAHELNMKPTRLTGLFKALGAIVKPCTVGQAEAFGIPKAAASTYKVALLKVPFKLPELSRRVRKR